MKKSLLPVLLSALLVACSTAVPLDAPVVDNPGTSVSAGTGAGGQTGAQSGSGVTSVDLGSVSGGDSGPANVGKVVYFDFDSYVIKPEYTGVIDAHVRYLNARKNLKITVEGHTDSAGGREYNLALGQKRAEAVARAMRLSGLADRQIEAVSFGKEKPAALGGDEASMAKNRRAEINYR